MSKIYKTLKKSLKDIQEETAFKPKVALVLGSGLGDFAEGIRVEASIDYADIEGFPVSTVPGHRGRYVFGYVGDVPVVAMQGRVHYYEGYDVSDVVMPIRLMGMMGAEVLFLTNASGAINTSFSAGDFMLIRDHILLGVPSPLIGTNIDELGTRFPDMSEVYDAGIRETIRGAAEDLQMGFREGVYIQVSGPNFETPAEIRAYGVLGADVVGMSTAVEAVAANHMGLKVCGISCIANMAAGISQNKLAHEEVQETANRRAPDFKKLITESIVRIGKI
ncbi:purine-nucleoside phosphorylase [Sporobacter termitidis DSM 10068]|uniref:Purine nucleoside phosphorylase n=1 Tax=Sporobacter termitidis DSM 10068 TaxID=1123282 RepID=A0A1M5TPS4_9FIRM|nr:purine-nucleoside phosphorylase [Sporobacter termitidis]SHH52670.1 purine-nucleoside phosphorylase [Sporobacter termitidis DSM 10068]